MDTAIGIHSLADSLTAVVDRSLAFLPTLLGAVFLLAIGWLIARGLRAASRHLVDIGLRRLARTRPLRQPVQQSKLYQALPAMVGRLIFWTILFIFLAASIELLGLPAISSVLAYLSAYLPRLLAAIIIVFAGLWLGELARAFLSRAAASGALARTELIGRCAQVLIILLAAIIALEQLGVDNTVLITLTITLLAGILGAAALAFGFGARNTVANILAAHYVKREYAVGNRIRIGDIEGTVTGISSTSVSMETDAGQVLMPANRFNIVESVRLK